MRRIAFVFFCILLLGGVFSVGSLFAQQQMPNYVLHAAQTLNAQHGANIDVNNVIWNYVDYASDIAGASENCPRLTTPAPAPNNTRVYRVEFQPVRNGIYGDELWEALVFADLSYVGLCNAPAPALPTAIPGTALPTMTPSSCGAMPSRLVIGQEGRVTAGDSPNNLRGQAGSSGEYLGEIPPLGIFLVLDGPRCTSDGAWWYVNYNGTAGWTLEGQSGNYFLEPMTLATNQPSQAATVAPLSAAATPVVCNPAMPSRLIIGALARVTPGIPNNLRAQAGSSGQYVGEIPAEGIFRVLAGPTCASGMAWWQVDYNGIIGWTGEGADGDYWLEPQFAAIPLLSADNLNTLQLYKNFTLTNANILQFSPNNTLFGASSGIIIRHEAANAFDAPNTLNWLEDSIAGSESPLLTMQTAGDVLQWMATKEANGISVLYSADGIAHQERYLVNLNASQALFSPDARYLLLVDETQSIQVFDTTVGQVLAILPNDSGEAVSEMAFSPDGRVFAAGFTTGFVVWQVSDWSVLSSAFFESPQNFQGLTLNNSHFAFAIASSQDAIAFAVPLIDIDSWPDSSAIRHSGAALDLVLAPDSSFLLIATETGLEFSALPEDEMLFSTSLGLSLGGNLREVSISGDGRFLAIATENGLELWGAAPTP